MFKLLCCAGHTQSKQKKKHWILCIFRELGFSCHVVVVFEIAAVDGAASRHAGDITVCAPSPVSSLGTSSPPAHVDCMTYQSL